MQAERPVDTINRWFGEGWNPQNLDLEYLTTQLHCISNETNRAVDSYFWNIREGVLMDPDESKPVLEYIKQNELYQRTEYAVAQELQKRVAESDEGVFIWHSPRLAGVYPDNKTMIYQIAYNARLEKVLTYTLIIYDGEIENPEEYRKTLVSAPDTNETFLGILAWIEKVSKKKPSTEKGVSRQTAQYYAEKIRAGVPHNIVLEEMQAAGFIGQYSISCPGKDSFSNYTSARANILIFASTGEKKFVKKCGECDAEINDYISAGYECKKCHKIYRGVC